MAPTTDPEPGAPGYPAEVPDPADHAAARDRAQTATRAAKPVAVGSGPTQQPLGSETGRADAVRNRAAILDAALGVLATEPTASLAQVARKAGLSRATLYRHFPNREALRDAIHDEALTCASEALGGAALDEGEARAALHRGVRSLVVLGPRFRVLIADGAEPDAAFRQRRDEVLRPLRTVILRGQRSGEISSAVHPGWAQATLAALLVAAVRTVDSGAVSPDDAAVLLCLTLFEGLGGAR